MCDEKNKQVQEPEVSMVPEGNSQSRKKKLGKYSVDDVEHMIEYINSFKEGGGINIFLPEEIDKIGKHLFVVLKMLDEC